MSEASCSEANSFTIAVADSITLFASPNAALAVNAVIINTSKANFFMLKFTSEKNIVYIIAQLIIFQDLRNFYLA